MNLKALPLFFVLLIAADGLQAGNSDWELKKDKSGVKVWTRAVEGRSLKESKAVSTFSTNVDNIMNVIFDYEDYPDWSPRCISARQVSRSGDVIKSYTLSDSPWPVTDRDIVLKNTITRRADGSVRIDMVALDDDTPADGNSVRITYFEGFYELKPVSAGRTEVTYQSIFDPAGSIPAWMANMAVVDTPYDLLHNMKEQLGVD